MREADFFAADVLDSAFFAEAFFFGVLAIIQEAPLAIRRQEEA